MSAGSIIGTVLGWLGYNLGQRTDSASSSGSLNSKAQYLVDNYTSARASKLDNLDAKVSLAKNVVTVQRGVTTLSSSKDTVNVTINSVDTTKSFVNIHLAGYVKDTVEGAWWIHARLTSSTNLRVLSGDNSTSNTEDLIVSWEVVQIA